MKKATLIAWVTLCICLAAPNVVIGDDLTPSQDLFEQAALSLWKWIQTLEAPYEKWVAKENRKIIPKQLRSLNEAIVSVESAKSNLLREIRSSRGLPKEIEKLQSIMPEITSAVDQLRIQLLGVSVLLREEFRHGGMKCEELLSSAVGEQKQWLIGVHNRPQSLASSSERTKVIKKAEAALLSLDNASKELAKVTKDFEENYKRFEDDSRPNWGRN